MRVLLAGLVLFLAACSSSPTEPTTTISWRLSTVGGVALPTNLLAATPTSCGSDIRGGDFILSLDGTYTGSKSYGTMVAGEMKCHSTYVENGTYTITPTTLTLRNVNTVAGFSRDLPITNGAMSENIEGRAYVYHR